MVPTRRKLQIATDYHEVRLPKCKEVCEFHSPFEFLAALQKVGDRSVVAFEPQPEKIRGANGKMYTPDYLVQTTRKKTYGEIKSERGLEREQAKIEPLLQDFCAKRGADCCFESHEEIEKRGVEAWALLKVTRWDLQYRDVNLAEIKRQVMGHLRRRSDWTLDETIRSLNAHPQDRVIASVCQLFMHGDLLFDLSGGFGFEMKVSPA